MQLRKEFVLLAMQEGANMRQLCRRFGISPTTGYKWVARERQAETLSDRSRKPLHSPGRCPQAVEQRICQLREQHPAWGARKLAHRLKHLGEPVPAVSTVHAVLQRYGLIDPAAHSSTPWQRFEHDAPNDLWQMDFKGHVPMLEGRCHPLTVLDDHSRYAVCLQACGNETEATVRERLQAIFRCHGLPARMTMDNGSPWGDDGAHYTALDVWLMKQGIRVTHSRPYHPQTQGKDERFHRSLKAEVLQGLPMKNLAHAQSRFDRWREIYNQQRPHQALDMQVPIQRYRPSARSYNEHPSAPEYADGDIVRKVHEHGKIGWKNQAWRVGKAFIGEQVALRPNCEDGVFDVYWGIVRIAQLDLRTRLASSGRAVA
jgi:transposase InsO family protein